MDQQEEKFIRMTQPPVGGLILRLAVPCIVSMLVTTFYNMADTFFVGMLKSNAATGAVGVVFSMMTIIQAVGFFFGHGSGNYISRQLGSKNYDEASKMAATGFFSALTAGLLICILGQIFLRPLARLLGSTETILPYTEAYLRVILIGAPWMTASLVLNNQLRFQGSASYAMVGITAGAVLNIALDPIMIFWMDLGVAGAGWATIISQLVSFCLLLAGCRRGSNVRLHIKNVQLKGFYYKMIVKGGLPSLARQGLGSLATICLNQACRGFGQGFQPVCGFNYGAKLYKRVKDGFWFCVKYSFLFLVVVSALGYIFAPQLIALFRDDPEVIACGTTALRLQCLTFPLQSWLIIANMMEQTIGRTIPATFLAAARQGVFFIPAVLILPLMMKLLGIQAAQSVADILSFISAVPIQLYVMKTMDRESIQRK